MNTKISILFYTKRAKANSEGLYPIYMRVTVNGARIETSTKRFIAPAKWNSDAGKLKGNSEEARSINSYLDLLKNEVYEYQKQLLLEGQDVTISTMRSKLLKTDERKLWILEIFRDHNRKMAALLGDEYAPGTLERYKTSFIHTKDFIRWKYNQSDIDIKKIDHAFITEYEFYLRSVRKCNNNSAVKYIKNFGKIIRICIANGWNDKNPFVNYKSKVK